MEQSKKKKIIRFSLLGLVLALIVIQFIRPDRSELDYIPEDDFIAITQPPADVENILRVACYDCHSNQTAWPWYTNVAPISWWISKHIRHGRDHLNFSEWGTFEEKKANHKLEECVEMMDEGWMPLGSYTWIHRDAKLSDEEFKKMSDWFKTL